MPPPDCSTINHTCTKQVEIALTAQTVMTIQKTLDEMREELDIFTKAIWTAINKKVDSFYFWGALALVVTILGSLCMIALQNASTLASLQAVMQTHEASDKSYDAQIGDIKSLLQQDLNLRQK